MLMLQVSHEGSEILRFVKNTRTQMEIFLASIFGYLTNLYVCVHCNYKMIFEDANTSQSIFTVP